MNRTGRTAATALALVTALAACATTTAGSGAPDAAVGSAPGGQPDSLPTALPSPGDAAVPTASGAADPTAAPTAAARRVTVGSASVPVPAGTQVRQDGDYVCLVLRGATGCSLEVVDIGRLRAGGGSVSTPAPGEQYGWWWGSDVPSCEADGRTSPIARESVVRKGFERVGSKNAAYASYLVACADSDLDFDPKIWWLPTSRIAFRQRTGVAGADEAVAPILAGVTFG